VRLLIAVKSCQRDLRDGVHQAIRETWGKVLPTGVDLLFFVGGEQPTALAIDERHVVAPDGYWELHPKMLAILDYARQEKYDFVDLCDTDTYLVITKLMSSGFDSYDYSGAPVNPKNGVFGKAYPAMKTDYNNFVVNPLYAYISGGHGAILSKRAIEIIATSSRGIWNSEDLIIGQILAPFIRDGKLTAKELPDFANHIVHPDNSHGGPVAWHLGCGYYGGGRRNEQRLDVGESLRKKHQMMQGMI
jgi:hypothetical protein